ncbi:MAG: hypothetical protein JSR99_02425 [Proteobacteria bacterium]|nr:hypothetical protein [Pseudomonadota bacterium]
MQDLWWQFQNADSFTVCTAVAFAAIVCWFIHEIVGSPTLAWLSTPLLAAGGIVAPTLLAQQMITLSYDQTINTVSGTALGTLAVLLLILCCNWVWAVIVEWRVRRTKLSALPTPARRIRR